jgi:hypothetical protein
MVYPGAILPTPRSRSHATKLLICVLGNDRKIGRARSAYSATRATAALFLLTVPRAEHHDGWVGAVRRAVSQVSAEEAATAFLASLASRRLNLRSALGSYAIARFLPAHDFELLPTDVSLPGSWSSGMAAHWRECLSRHRGYAALPREQEGLGLIDIHPELDGRYVAGRRAIWDGPRARLEVVISVPGDVIA